MESSKLYYGEVIFFSPKRGYGFIKWEIDGVDQKDLFVHYSDINCDGFKTLYKGQKISFTLGINKNNIPKAIEVLVLRH